MAWHGLEDELRKDESLAGDLSGRDTSKSLLQVEHTHIYMYMHHDEGLLVKIPFFLLQVE